MSKYTKIGLGVIATMTLLSSPIIYIHYRAENLVMNKKYKEAIEYYSYVEPLALTYSKKKVKAFYLKSIMPYKENKFSPLHTKMFSGKELKELIPKKRYQLLSKEDPLIEFYLTVPSLFYKSYKYRKKAFMDKIEKMRTLVEKSNFEEKQHLLELTSLVKLNHYKKVFENEYVFVNDDVKDQYKNFEDAYKEYKGVEEKYNTSIYYKTQAHLYLAEIYNKMGMDLFDELEDSYSKRVIKNLEGLYRINQRIVNKHGRSFCLHHVFPFATQKEIDQRYQKFITSYKVFSTDLTPKLLVRKLSNTDLSYKAQKKYAEEFPIINLMEKISLLGNEFVIDSFHAYEKRYTNVLDSIEKAEIEHKNELYEIAEILYLYSKLNKNIESCRENRSFEQFTSNMDVIENHYEELKKKMDTSPSFCASYHKIMIGLGKINKYERIELEIKYNFSLEELLINIRESNQNLVEQYGKNFALENSNNRRHK